jgi:oligoribonuclease NrnB/cAMP/cGMP phosphodiesterase (DHH superfamily)
MPLPTPYVPLAITPETLNVVAAALAYMPIAEVDMVVYHSMFGSPCNDGSASAMAAWLTIGNKKEFKELDEEGEKVLSTQIQYVPYNPNAKDIFDLTQFTGKNVLMLDCSLKLAILVTARALAKKVMIVDHHMPEQKLNGLQGVEGCFFSPHNSAGAMSWLMFQGVNTPLPVFVDLVQRHDVFKIGEVSVTTPESTNLAAYLRTLKGFDQYKVEYPELLKPEALNSAIHKGAGIIEANEMWLKNMVDKTKLCILRPNAAATETEQFKVLAVELEPVKMRDVTELGERLWKKVPAGNPEQVQLIMFWCRQGENGENVQVSLRSKFRTGTGLDVAAFAKKYFEGGGHDEAAGGMYNNPPTNFLEAVNASLLPGGVTPTQAAVVDVVTGLGFAAVASQHSAPNPGAGL